MICPDNLNSSFTASLVHHNKNLPFSELINEPSVFGVCHGIATILELQGLNSFSNPTSFLSFFKKMAKNSTSEDFAAFGKTLNFLAEKVNVKDCFT